MSEEHVEAAQRMYDVFTDEGMNESAVAALVEEGVLADEAELDLTNAYPDGEVEPRRGGDHFGSQPWGRSMRFEAESFRVVDGDRVLVLVRAHGVAGGSGLEVEGRNAHLLTFRGGRLVRAQVYTERGKALEAAGLSE